MINSLSNPDSRFTCGHICVQNIFSNVGLDVSADEIFVLTGSKPHAKINILDIAIALLSKGIVSDLTLDLHDFVDGQLTNPKLEFLKNTLTGSKPKSYVERLIRLRDAGVTVVNARRTFFNAKLSQMISEGYIIVTVVDSKIFSTGLVKEGQHFIIIDGGVGEELFIVSTKRFKKSKSKVLDAMQNAKIPSFIGIKNKGMRL